MAFMRAVTIPDISAATEWSVALKGCSIVIHLAGRAHKQPQSQGSDLADFNRVNVDGSLRLAIQAMESGIRRFIFISSIGVNGPATDSEAFNERSAALPKASYGFSKLAAEIALKDLIKGSDMELVIIRPPLVYAGHAPGNFHRLLKLVHAGLPLPFATINNRRSMIALENLISFIVLCIDHPLAADETFLISDGDDLSTPEIVSNIAIGMGKNARLFPFPESLMSLGAQLIGKRSVYNQLSGSLCIDPSKAKNMLSWVPVIKASAALEAAGRDYVRSQHQKY